MNRFTKRIITVILCFSLLVISSAFSTPVYSKTKQDYQNEIDQAKQKKAEAQAKKKDPEEQRRQLESEISSLQAEINACNNKISTINSTISKNKQTIASKEAAIEKDKLEFKKRLRAIYMSDYDSNIKILLGADDFSEFLQLSQLTASISAKDKAMIENLSNEIAQIEKLNTENQQLLDSQIALRNDIKAKQDTLKSKEEEINKVLAELNSDINSADKAISDANKRIKEIEAEERRIQEQARSNSQTFINPNTGFQWPVNGFRTISAGFQSNDSVHKGHHNGIDISGGGIQGQPIRAIADGIVGTVNNGCSHNYKKYGNCCGNGYGNYCVINHGTIKGSNYTAYYAHAQKIIVSPGQKVTQGQVIGYVGTTGWSTGYHLHLGILKNNVWVNPYPLFF